MWCLVTDWGRGLAGGTCNVDSITVELIKSKKPIEINMMVGNGSPW